MSEKAVTGNGQGRTGAPAAHSAWIWRVAATVVLTVLAVLCYRVHEALRQRVAERWIELSEGIRYVILPETSNAVDDQLEAAFAPVYTSIEPFVARIDRDTAPRLTSSSGMQSAIESGLVGGLERRLSLAQDSIGRVMQTEMRAELEERFVELEDWFDREVGWLPARPRAGYRRIMLKPICDDARELLALTVNPNALREEMRGVGRLVVVRLTTGVTNQLASAAFDSPAQELGNAAPERVVPRTAWRNLPTTSRHFTNQFSDPSFLAPSPSAGTCAPSTGLTARGRLIQTSAESSAARGGPATKRSGRAT